MGRFFRYFVIAVAGGANGVLAIYIPPDLRERQPYGRRLSGRPFGGRLGLHSSRLVNETEFLVLPRLRSGAAFRLCNIADREISNLGT
jgi:hypothetical protein